MLNPLTYLENPITLIPLALIVVCVVHAVRRGNIFPWIYIIVFLPGIGSLIYLAVEIIPELVRGRGAARVKSGAAAVLAASSRIDSSSSSNASRTPQ